MNKKPRSWLAKINLISPKICRLLARKCHGRRPMTNRDIAKVSGLSLATIKRLYKLDRWDTVPIRTAFLFSKACGVDLMRHERTTEALRYKNPVYLRKIRHAGTRKLLYEKILGVKDTSGG